MNILKNKLSLIIGVLVISIVILAGCSSEQTQPTDESLGGDYITTVRDFTEGISVDGTTIIDGSGNITSTGDMTSTSGRYIAGVETGGTCSSGLIIDLSSKTKGNLTTIGQTNTACAISFTNGTVGEAITLSHNYSGTGAITFADVTGFDAAFVPVGATCSGIDAGVTAANNDHFYLQGYMASATEITITGCTYFDAA